jgi:molybdopterin-guanine dinucleotide biosynthesis protein A
VRWLSPFVGIVLVGGTSSRMGTDKAYLDPGDGRGVLVERSRQALSDAGAPRVLSVGGDVGRLAGLGFDAYADDVVGSGPLAGLITGLRVAPLPLTVVLTCDLPAIDATTVRALVAELDGHPDADAVIPVIDGRRQVLTAGYRTQALAALQRAFADGERSVRRAATALRVIEIDRLDPGSFVDLDRPEEVEHYARRTKHSDKP